MDPEVGGRPVQRQGRRSELRIELMLLLPQLVEPVDQSFESSAFRIRHLPKFRASGLELATTAVSARLGFVRLGPDPVVDVADPVVELGVAPLTNPKLADANAAIQVHTAYSSHMWPR